MSCVPPPSRVPGELYSGALAASLRRRAPRCLGLALGPSTVSVHPTFATLQGWRERGAAGREWARDCPVRLRGHGRLPRVRQDWMGGDKARPPGKIRARLVLVTRGPSLSSGSCQRPRAVAQPPDGDCSSQGPRPRAEPTSSAPGSRGGSPMLPRRFVAAACVTQTTLLVPHVNPHITHVSSVMRAQRGAK